VAINNLMRQVNANSGNEMENSLVDSLFESCVPTFDEFLQTSRGNRWRGKRPLKDTMVRVLRVKDSFWADVVETVDDLLFELSKKSRTRTDPCWEAGVVGNVKLE